MQADWFEPLIHGLVALLVAAVLFVLARVRFNGRGGTGGGADVGLD